MGTHRIHSEKEVVYFVTFTCIKWLALFHSTDSYDIVYKWYSTLDQKNCKICGYVIMPNHVHLLIYVGKDSPNLNYLVANGKRFMAYEIVKKLEMLGRVDLLGILQDSVRVSEKKKGKKHKVFRQSFDAKVCFSIEMLEQKLDYIHANSVSGKWNLVDDFTEL